MYERYTVRAWKVMQLASIEARRLNHVTIGTEHVLLALIAEGNGVAANALRNLGADFQKIREEVEKLQPPSADPTPEDRLPFSPELKRAIDNAQEEAPRVQLKFKEGLFNRMGAAAIISPEFAQILQNQSYYVGTEHLLLALVQVEDGVPAEVLTQLGLTHARIREEVLEILGHGEPEEPDEPDEFDEPATEPLQPILDWRSLVPDGLLVHFTDRAKEALRLMESSPWTMNHGTIGTEHLLIALAAERKSVASHVFRKLGIDPLRIFTDVEKLRPPSIDLPPIGEIPLTPGLKKVIEYVPEEAMKLNQHYPGTEHLLLALMREEVGLPAQILANLGLERAYTKGSA